MSVISKCGHEAVSSKKVILQNEPKCDQAGVEIHFRKAKNEAKFRGQLYEISAMGRHKNVRTPTKDVGAGRFPTNGGQGRSPEKDSG